MATSTQTNQALAAQLFAESSRLNEAMLSCTVNSLKTLIKEINTSPAVSCGYVKLSGNKVDLIDRISTILSEKKAAGDVRAFQVIRDLIVFHGPIQYERTRCPYSYATSTPAGTPLANTGGTSNITPKSLQTNSTTQGVVNRPSAPLTQARINFKPSPFYEIKQFMGSLIFCEEAPTSTDRKNAVLFFTLTSQQIELLSSSQPTHEARLFCTSAELYAASLSGRNPASVEFPLTCEARVNGTQLSTNLRGSKKNIGRVPPPNLNKDKALVLKEGRPNRIELTYTNAPKRHVLIVGLCQITKAETLVEHVRQQRYRKKQDVLEAMKQVAQDDDIQAGAATLSLKCPLSYMRMTLPCRSLQCSHIQCFDAMSFFSVNEQAPSWMCPVCNKPIKADDISVDGYVHDILNQVPDNYETVIVEPDGGWQTHDGKITSSGVPSTLEKAPAKVQTVHNSAQELKQETTSNTSQAISSYEIVLLDTPSPEPVETKQETSTHSLSVTDNSTQPMQQSASQESSQRPSLAAQVIDLTLDSDDSDDEVIVRRSLPSRSSLTPRPPPASLTPRPLPVSHPHHIPRPPLPSHPPRPPPASHPSRPPPPPPPHPLPPSASAHTSVQTNVETAPSRPLPPHLTSASTNNAIRHTQANHMQNGASSRNAETQRHWQEQGQARKHSLPDNQTETNEAVFPPSDIDHIDDGADYSSEDEQIRRPGKRVRLRSHSPATQSNAAASAATANGPSKRANGFSENPQPSAHRFDSRRLSQRGPSPSQLPNSYLDYNLDSNQDFSANHMDLHDSVSDQGRMTSSRIGGTLGESNSVDRNGDAENSRRILDGNNVASRSETIRRPAGPANGVNNNGQSYLQRSRYSDSFVAFNSHSTTTTTNRFQGQTRNQVFSDTRTLISPRPRSSQGNNDNNNAQHSRPLRYDHDDWLGQFDPTSTRTDINSGRRNSQYG